MVDADSTPAVDRIQPPMEVSNRNRRLGTCCRRGAPIILGLDRPAEAVHGSANLKIGRPAAGASALAGRGHLRSALCSDFKACNRIKSQESDLRQVQQCLR
jgi:hypothetical protein